MYVKKLVLLLALVLTSVSTLLSKPDVRVRAHQGTTWFKMVQQGGMVRRDNHYLSLPNGVADLMAMNYVDGYTFGPHCVLGVVTDESARWEVEPELRYACARQTMIGSLALRYHFPLPQMTMVEVFGGQYTADFDSEGMMDEPQRIMPTGIFGWNDYKLYERTCLGVRTSATLANDWHLDGTLSWEQRHRLDNHRHRNIFRVKGDANIPDNYLHPASQWQTDPLLNFAPDRLLRLDIKLSYTPETRYYVIDDMTVRTASRYPTWSLRMTSGVGEPLDESSSDITLRYLSLEAQVAQRRQLSSRSEWAYMASVGGFLHRQHVSLADFRHFDASRFCWQQRPSLTWFSLLENYWLSTSEHWAEAHAEYLSPNLTWSRMVKATWLREYAQVHVLHVPHAPLHTEVSYGLALGDSFRVGASIGLDDLHYDGIALNIVFSLSALQAK